MDKSIESIWKEGFLNREALVAPKPNNLHNQKSKHIIDKFKRIFRINLNAIVVGSLLFLGISFFMGIPLMGIGFFLTLSIIVVVNRKLFNELCKIDVSESSYQYIKAFDKWMKHQVSVNRIMARFYYPLFFLSTVVGFWHYYFNGKQLGVTITDTLILNFHGIDLFFGLPVFIILAVFITMVLLSYLGGRIYHWDLMVVYGGILRKLDELVADMENLKNEHL